MATETDTTRRRIVLVTHPGDRGGRIFDTSPSSGNRDLGREPLADLRRILSERGVDLATLDGPDDLAGADLVVFHVQDRAVLAECIAAGIGAKTVLLAWEPPVVDPSVSAAGLARLSRCYGRILTWNADLVDDDIYLRLRYPHAMRPIDSSPLPFPDRGLIVNLSGNKRSNHPKELYSRREELIGAFERLDPGFELWGPGWQNSGHPSWKGLAPSKREVYHRFRFALCLENMASARGYSTEKPFDAIQWGVVPVYQGDPELTAVLPSGAWVDAAAFDSPSALLEELRSWSEERHQLALASAKEFFASEASAPWRAPFLAEQLLRCLELVRIRPRVPRPDPAQRAVLALARWKRRAISRFHP